jgi:hypothetical protein
MKVKNTKPVPAIDIKPEDHKGLSGLKPTIEISNQGHSDYDLNSALNSPTRSGLQPKGKKR